MDKYDMPPYEFYINSTETMSDGNKIYHLIPIKESKVCPICGGRGVLHGRPSGGARKVRDLSPSMQQVGLLIDCHRFICKDCDNTWVSSFESIDNGARMTVRMRDYIKNRSLIEPFKKTADDLGVSDTTIRKIFDESIKELEDKHPLYAPEVLGIDENHLMKNYRAVFVDVKKRLLLDIRPNRTKKTVKAWITALPDYKNIKVVTMDMWKPYRDVVKAVLPDAVVVVDRFHVVKEITAAMERVRKHIGAGAEDKDRKYLKKSRFLLLSNQDSLTKTQIDQRDEIFIHFPDLKRPYYMKEMIRTTYEKETRADAEKWYENLKEMFGDYEDVDEFSSVFTTIDNWHEEIFNYFDYKYTNAITENINKMINDIGEAGRGYSLKMLRAKAVYSQYAERPEKFKFPI